MAADRRGPDFGLAAVLAGRAGSDGWHLTSPLWTARSAMSWSSIPNKALAIQWTQPLSSPWPHPRIRRGRPEIRACPQRLCRNL